MKERKNSNILVPLIVLVVVAMIIIPMPVPLLDIFMAANLLFSLAVLLMVIYTGKPSDFSVFPTMLLVSTVFGLGLNVSSTRLILSKGAEFDGKLIRAFGNFVVGSSGNEGLVIGLIIFVIFILVQLIVITKGAGRAAEVAARFNLDAMNQRNLSIDADVAGGHITAAEGERRKKEYQQETDFYKSMDGASKFVSGNVKVGIVITLVNIIGGIIIGMLLRKESFGLAVANYTALTIGDGLVTQFPSIMISVATAIIVTSSTGSGSMAADFAGQFSKRPEIYRILAVFSVIMALLPGFRRAWYIFIPLGIFLFYLGHKLGQSGSVPEKEEKPETKPESAAPAADISISPVSEVHPLYLGLGYGLYRFASDSTMFGNRITELRKKIASELGFAIPPVRITDNLNLKPAEYSIRIRDVEAARASVRADKLVAIADGPVSDKVLRNLGEEFNEPVYGKKACWISAEERENARDKGCIVTDIPSLIIVHMEEIIRRNAADLLDRQTVQSMLDELSKRHPAAVKETMKLLTLIDIHKVLRNLLKEQVSIRDLGLILETLGDSVSVSGDIGYLTEETRRGLRRQISHSYADEGMHLHVITLSSETEKKLLENPYDIRFNEKLAGRVMELAEGRNVVLMCRKELRAGLGALLAGKKSFVPVLSADEKADDIIIEFHGKVDV